MVSVVKAVMARVVTVTQGAAVARVTVVVEIPSS